jgi:nitroreductase
MEFTEVIKNRYSVRAYQDKAILADKLERILEAARLAPTAKNLQSFNIFVIKTAKHKESLTKIYSREWLIQAPLVLLICGKPADNWIRADGKNYNDVDVAIVMDHIILAATNEGLGTCWIGAFDCAAAKKELKLPAGLEPIAFTPLGYPADQPREKRRKSISEIVEYL